MTSGSPLANLAGLGVLICEVVLTLLGLVEEMKEDTCNYYLFNMYGDLS